MRDPALSLRWGQLIRCWIVERQCPISRQLKRTFLRAMKAAVPKLGNPLISPRERDRLMQVCEEGLSAENGRRIVMWTNDLDNRAFDALWLSDLQTHGIDHIEETKNRNERAREKRMSDAFGETSEQVVDYVRWAERAHSADIPHGKADVLSAEVFGHDTFRDKKFSTSIIDPNASVPKPDARVELT